MYNSTIKPKKRQLDCGCYDYSFSRNRCKFHATLQDSKPIDKVSKKREQEFIDENLSGLIEDLDAVFSRYMRVKYSNSKGVCKCFTCGSEKRYQDMQNGHFVSRANLATRWLEDNCRPQCIGCNCIANGRIDVFAANLEKEKRGIVEYLQEQGREVYRPTRNELKELLIEYRHKLQVAMLKFK